MDFHRLIISFAHDSIITLSFNIANFIAYFTTIIVYYDCFRINLHRKTC